MRAPFLSDFISSAEFLVRIVFIFNSAFFSVSSEKMSSCTIFFTIVSGALLRNQISCYKRTRDIS